MSIQVRKKIVEEILEAAMANENKQNDRAMKDYLTPTLQGCLSSIVRLSVQANNFELKMSLI